MVDTAAEAHLFDDGWCAAFNRMAWGDRTPAGPVTVGVLRVQELPDRAVTVHMFEDGHHLTPGAHTGATVDIVEPLDALVRSLAGDVQASIDALLAGDITISGDLRAAQLLDAGFRTPMAEAALDHLMPRTAEALALLAAIPPGPRSMTSFAVAPEPDDPDASPIQAFVERLRRRRPGLQIAITDGQQQLVVSSGWAGRGRPVDDDLEIPWLSCSKPLLGLLALQLEARHPGLQDVSVGELVDGCDGAWAAITIGDLLRHRARVTDDPIASRLGADEATQRAMAVTGVLAPGDAPRYVPFVTWSLLGLALEVVGGGPLGQLVHDLLVAPADGPPAITYLGTTTSPGEGSEVSPMYDFDGDTARPSVLDSVDLGTAWIPAIGARSSARAAAAFWCDVLGRGPADLADRLRDDPVEHSGGRWGAGVQLGPSAGSRSLFGEDASPTALGHIGGTSAVHYVDPASGLVAILHTNGVATPSEHARDVAELVSLAVADLWRWET